MRPLRSLFLLAIFLGAWVWPAFAQSPSPPQPSPSLPLILQPDQPERQIAPFVMSLEDVDKRLTLDEAMAAYQDGRFQTAPDPLDFGFTDSRIWLRLGLRNASDQPRPAIVALGVSFMHEIDAWLVRTDGVERLLAQTEETPFDTRPTDDLNLALPLALRPGEEAVLYIAYWSAGSTSLPMTVETRESHAKRIAAAGAFHSAFYAIYAALIVVSLAMAAAARSRLVLCYAVYVAMALLFVLHGDGATFRYLWPDWPQWNVFASLPIGLALNISAGVFTRTFLDTRRLYPKFDIAFLAIMALSVVTLAAGLAGFERPAKMLSFPLVLLASLTFLAGGIRALRDRAPGSPYYVVGWTSISAAALAALLLNTPLAPGAAQVTYDLVRVSMAFDALMMALALVMRFNRIRQERDELLERELSAMRANMALIERINALEERVAVAEASGAALAGAYHDMRQPLLALRLAVQRVARHPEIAGDVAEIEASVAYLEKLADTMLVEAVSGAPPPGALTAEGGVETFEARIVLDVLRQMFRHEAEAKGLAFETAPSRVLLRAAPTVLIRILSNFAANAVRYTRRGRILVGCRRREGLVWLCVVDTGPGMSGEELARVLESGGRGAAAADAPGFGMGLAIARRLAEENGLAFQAQSEPGKGSCFAIGVARAQGLAAPPRALAAPGLLTAVE